MTTGATFNRGASKQDWTTPPELIAAVEKRFGKLVLDLAAEEWNSRCPYALTPADDALSIDWTTYSRICRDAYIEEYDREVYALSWLNPPYSDIKPWARKCAEECNRGWEGAFLVPAAVGSTWFRDYVIGQAHVLFLRGRPTFLERDEETGELRPCRTWDKKREKWIPAGYPKDCMVCMYGWDPDVEVWDWRKA